MLNRLFASGASTAFGRLRRSLPAAVPLLLLRLPALASAQTPQGCPGLDTLPTGLPEILSDIRSLDASAFQDGAGGSPGAPCATAYVAGRLRNLGLTPAGPDGSYLQSFSVREGTALGPDNELSIGSRSYVLGRDWVPFGFSASVAIEGRLLYAGSGVTALGQGPAGVAHPDLAAKIAVVDWGDPDVARGPTSQREGLYFKASVAAGRGAAALVVLLPEGITLPSPEGDIRPGLPIPVVAVAGGAAAASVRHAAVHDGHARLSTDVRPVQADEGNVVASLPGGNPTLRDRWVIVEAHVGGTGDRGGGGSGPLAPTGTEQVPDGSRDEAGAAASLLDVAGRLSAGPMLERSVLFLGLSGEGPGGRGARYFLAHPTVDLSSIVAVVDLDGVGRTAGATVVVLGTGTASGWDTIVSGENEALDPPLELSFDPRGYAPVAPTAFDAKRIPVLRFVTGTRTDYDRPSATWRPIDVGGIDRVAQLAAHVARRLAGSPGSLSFVPLRRSGSPGMRLRTQATACR